MDRRKDAARAMRWAQTWEQTARCASLTGSIPIDLDADKNRRSLTAESPASICPTFTQCKSELGLARDRGAIRQFQFPQIH
jgi:hypothetical protein